MSDMPSTTEIDELDAFMRNLETLPPVQIDLDDDELDALIDQWAQGAELGNDAAPAGMEPEAVGVAQQDVADWLATLEPSSFEIDL